MENENVKHTELFKSLEDHRLMVNAFLTAISNSKPNPLQYANTTVKALYKLVEQQSSALNELTKIQRQ